MSSGEMKDENSWPFTTTKSVARLTGFGTEEYFATFIDRRGYPTVHAAAAKASLSALDLVVWADDRRHGLTLSLAA